MAKLVICPNCFESFDAKSLLFRCATTCRAEEDAILARHLGLPSRTESRVILPTREEIWNGRALCNPSDGGCGELSAIHICPMCHSEIPQCPWQNKNFICSVVGSNYSGKSCFIAVLMHQVFQEFVGSMGGNTSLDFSTENGRELFKNNYIGPIINEGMPPEATRGIATNPDVRRPLVYALRTWRYREFFYPLKKNLNTNLIIYDTPGEDFNEQRTAHALKSISNSHALVFVVDFATFDGVAQRVGVDRVSAQTPAEVMQTFYNVYCLQNPDMTIGNKIKVPTAIVLSKVDMIQDLLPQHSKILQGVSHEGGVDLEDLQQSSTEVRGLIDSFGGKALNDAIKTHFDNFMYFGVSSGNEMNGRFHVFPHRIMDPLVWLMLQRNLISAK